MRGPDFRFGAHETWAEQPPDDHLCPREIECVWGFARGFRAAPCRDAPAETERRRTWGWVSLLSFLAHGPKRACGDVYSLLCALHACVCRALPSLEGQGRQAPPGQAFVLVLIERERDQEERQWRFFFSVHYGSAA